MIEARKDMEKPRQIQSHRKSSKHAKKVEALLGYYRAEQEKRENAASIIQRAWRRWLDLGVFGYYKELIGFKRCGEPCHLMRCIDPREAELLDAAAGIHIRFRLGGLKFPPNIYYKIFTHRPIVDMCANSPKDYAKLAAKKGQPGNALEDQSGWYKRIENNGWRLLSIRFWKAPDLLTLTDNVKVKEFQHCRLQKKQDIERKRKKRKIEWLRKMYLGESLQVKTLDPGATLLIQRVTEGFFDAVGNEGTDNVMEWEVDEMLKWTTALNYEEYVKQWKDLGTSMASDGYQGFQFTQRQYGTYTFAQLREMINQMAVSHKRRMNTDVKEKSAPTNTPCN